MPVSLGANGGSYNYPQENDPAGWGDDATNWASAVSAALSNIGLGGTASADAVVNIISTTKGILIPRMTTTQRNAIGSPSTSLLIYNTTTTQYELYTGSTWQSLASYISGALTVTGAASLQSTLNVTGASTFANVTATGTILAASGTSGTPSISFSGDTNTGLYRSASDQLSFSTGGVERHRIASTGQQSSTVPDLSGSNTTLYPEYKCRAWVNFNGTGTVAIRASGNVSSITDSSLGKFVVNFATELPDSDYCAVNHAKQAGSSTSGRIVNGVTKTTTALGVETTNDGNTSYVDYELNDVAVFR